MYQNLVINDSKTAVVAIVVFNEKVLMLKRNKPPLNWSPPCGKVERGETLEAALKREVIEETGLSCNIYKYVSYWEGKHLEKNIRSYLYVCRCNTDLVKLSNEHSDFCWININNIESWKTKTDFDLSCWKNWINDFI